MKSDDDTYSFNTYTYDKDVSHKKLIQTFIMHEYLFSIVEHDEFVDFINFLQSSLELKSRKKEDYGDIFGGEKKSL